MRVRVQILGGFAVLALGFCVAEPVFAQSFNLERLPNTVQARDGLATNRLHPIQAGEFGLSLVADYTSFPLVMAVSGPRSTEYPIVKHALDAHLSASVGVTSYLLAFATFDVPLVRSGSSSPGAANVAPTAEGGGLGDAWVGARLKALTLFDDRLSFGFQAALGLPLSQVEDAPYRGERSVSATPLIIADLRLPGVRFTANAGALLRPVTRTLNVTLGQEFRYAVDASVPLGDIVELYAELFGASPLTDFGDRQGVDLEWLGGAKFEVTEGLLLGCGAGTGLVDGIGSPKFRGLLSVGYQPPAPPPVKPAELPPPAADTDGDGVLDFADGCPEQPAATSNGCPVPDTDGDKLADNVDQCPTEAGTLANGCPDRDTDKDGIPAPTDTCPDQPGIAPNGCPDLDPDKDGVPTPGDKCTDQPETVNGFEDADGCPDQLPDAVAKFTGVVKGINFGIGKAVVRPDSFALLDQAAKVLIEFPELRMEISGHSDSTGTLERNLELSAARAEAVKQYLVSKGIAGERLTSRGAGPNEPIADNSTKDGQAQNRRIEFKILQ